MIAAIQKIAESITRLEKLLSACTRCGACLPVCPVYQGTGRESDAARGKLALLDALAGNAFEAPDGVMSRLNRCLLCGSCAHRCPAGVEVVEILSRARFIIKDATGLTAVQRVVLKTLLAEPERFNCVMRAAAKLQGVLLGKERLQSETVLLPFGPSRIRNRHVPPLAPTFFQGAARKRVRSQRAAGRHGMPRVMFFTGCLTDKLFPEIAQAAMAALTRAGFRILLPSMQGCCGMPAVSMGDLKTFERLLQHHAAEFSAQPYDYLVTPCASCAAMIKTLWPKLSPLVSDSLATRCAPICGKTMEISQFFVHLQAIPKIPAASAPMVVTYHDPCHLRKTLGITEEPRQLIQANPRYRLIESAEPDACCGMGGLFNWHHYELSMRIGDRKLENIMATGADVVATSCPACILQLRDLIAKTACPIPVKHVVQLWG